MRIACRDAVQFGMRSLGYPTVSFFISYTNAIYANTNQHQPAKPFEFDELRATTLRMQTNSKAARTKKRSTFSQTLLPVAALLSKLRTAQQTACKGKTFGINKARRRKLRHRDSSTIISRGFKMSSPGAEAVHT